MLSGVFPWTDVNQRVFLHHTDPDVVSLAPKSTQPSFGTEIYKVHNTSACAYQGIRNVCFSENLACFVFLKHPF